MKPVLWRAPFDIPVLGPLDFPAYFTLLTLGFALAAWLSIRAGRKLGMDGDRIYDLNLLMVACGLVGARILHLIADGHFQDYVNLCVDPKAVKATDALVTYCTSARQCGYDYLCDTARHVCYPPRDCLAALKLWRGGYAYYGGLLLAVPVAYWYLRRHRIPFWRFTDIAGPLIVLGLVFGRIGCYLNGCCFGRVTHSALAVVFPRGGAAWRQHVDEGLIHKVSRGGRMVWERAGSLPVHPAQLYEAAACLAIFAFTWFYVRPRQRGDGETFGWAMGLYAIARAAIEPVRADDRGVFFGGWVSTSQLISLPILAGSVWLVARVRRAARRRAAAPG